MRLQSVTIIGAGAVGSALAELLNAHGHRVAAVISRTAQHARLLAKSVKARSWDTTVESVDSNADLILISVPDSALADVAIQLARADIERATVVHTSGLLTSDALTPLRRRGGLVGGLHPIMSFPGSKKARENARRAAGGYFGIEGSPAFRGWAKRFVASLGCRACVIPKERKSLYHATCTFASNYALTLLEVVRTLSDRAGLPAGLEPFERLFLTTAEAGFSDGPVRSLTGPVVRGDGGALAKHARALRAFSGELTPLFMEFVHVTALQAMRAGRLTTRDVRRLEQDIRTPWKG